MRPGQQNKRGRGRGSNSNGGGNNNFNRKGGNPLSRSYDSSGPDVKIRGTAQHIAEKYAALARDAQSSGDRVMAENYLQHAEHYNRIIAAAQAQMQDRFQHQDRGDYQDRDGNALDQDDVDGMDGEDLGFAPQPVVEDAQPRQRRDQNNQGQNAQGQVQDQQPREPRRDREQRRDRRQDRPERQAAPVAEAAPVADGTGPQPVIEGIPAEVVAEEGLQSPEADAPKERRRRTAGTRPRRPRRGEAAGEEGEASEAALAEAATE